jgi:DNA-binding transcriptional MerR regulator
MYTEEQIIRIAKEEGVSTANVTKLIEGLRKEDKSEKFIENNLKKVLPRLR